MVKRDLTPEEQKLFKDRLQDASIGEAFISGFWAMFRPKKLHKLIDNLNRGMSWMYAYKRVKNNEKD